MEQFLLLFSVIFYSPLMLFIRIGHPCFIEIFIEIITIDAIVRNNTKISHVPFAQFPQ